MLRLMLCTIMKLRDYQTECIDTMHKHFKSSNRQLIQMPTGAGKTITFLKYISLYCKRSIIIVPTRELLEQVEESSWNFMHKSEVFAKHNSIINLKNHNIIIAASLNSQPTVNKLLTHNAELIIIDEAHRAQSATYRNFIEKYADRNPNVKICGFTATPERLDKQPLLELFEKLTFSRTIYDLVKAGHLCDMGSYRIKTGHRFNDRRITSGDFAPIAIKELNNESRNNIIYNTYKESCIGKKTLVFCVNVEHAQCLAILFQKQGVKAEAIYGNMPLSKRKKIIKDFRSGEINVLLNCQLLTEGFDEPSIETIIIARPTKSKSLYCQMIGRGLRNYPGKKLCYLYELTDNSHNICTFTVTSEREIELEYEYQNGIRLTKLKETLEGVNLTDFVLLKEKICVFENQNGYLASQMATEYQLKQLQENGIKYIEPVTFLEASFMLWKHRLQEKYAKNRL